MRTIGKLSINSLVACTLLCSLPSQIHAWEPNAADLDSAIKTGDFAGYLANATTWLNQKAPATLNETTLGTLLKVDQ